MSAGARSQSPIEYACPSCRVALERHAADTRDGRIERGALACPRCGVAAPVLAGFPLFGESFLFDGPPSPEWLRDREATLFGDPARYARFLEAKRRRPGYDSYAYFRPFNESTRALFPFVDAIRETLAPGDRILDTWCRTGWTGEMLAALFPEQQIVSLWEGDSNVLGYKGFRYWLGLRDRAPNLEIVFAHAEQPLPFATDYFAALHGLDSLHRYAHQPFLGECLRVTRDDGVLVFPHNHLTNSEPEPYFERGCIQYHGTFWRDVLDRALEGSGRRAFVMPEVPLFAAGRDPVRIEDQSDTEHYNALILLAPAAWEGREVAAPDLRSREPGAYVVVNPMFDVDLSTGAVRVDPDGLGESVKYMMSRHPIYEELYADVSDLRVSSLGCRLLYWAERGATVQQMTERVHASSEDVLAELGALQARDLVQVLAISPGMMRLQHFYGRQEALVPHHFGQLWADVATRYGERPLIVVDEDGSEFGVEEAEALMAGIAGLLASHGIARGDRVLVVADNHPELLLLLWTAWRLGVAVAPLDPQLPAALVRELSDRVGAKLVFCDRDREASVEGLSLPRVVFDVLDEGEDAEVEAGEHDFVDAVEPHLDEEVDWPELDPDDLAVILFTSGSTGRPKGVRLSQGSLFRTGRLMADLYDWSEEDVLLSLGGFYVMSGLRNPCVGALQGGATLLMAGERQRGQAIAVAELCRRWSVTVVSAVPALLSQLEAQRERLRGNPLRKVRLVLSTGAGLNEQVAADVEKHFDLQVRNYYGLTETGGVCTAVAPGDEGEAGQRLGVGVIGRPAGAVVEIVDEHGERVPEGGEGEIRVHGANVMQGYLGEPELTERTLRRGWLHTGDLGRRRGDGHIELVGRRDQRIKDRRGEIVYPEEVEQLLEVQDEVVEAAVAGYETGAGEQRLAAFVVPRDAGADETELVAALRQRIAETAGRSKLPARIIVLPELPHGPSGKVQKRKLLEDHLDVD